MQFKGHSGKVRSISWLEDDSGFVSAGWDGSIFQWQLFAEDVEQPQVQHFFQKGTNFSSVIMHQESIFSLGNDRMIKEIQNGNCVKKLDTGVSAGQLITTVTGALLFVSLAESERPGAIRCYQFAPLTGDYNEFQAHCLPVERIRVSYDDKYLFSAGQDGSLCMFTINDAKTRLLQRDRELGAIGYAKEIIITKGEIDELYKQIDTINGNMKEQQDLYAVQFSQAMQEKQKTIDNLEATFKHDQDTDKQRIESLLTNTREIETS